MAHEAIVSLNMMIKSFLNIPTYHNYFLPIPELVLRELWSSKSILELHHFEETERLIAFKGEILEAIPKFRDLLHDLINKSQSLDDESSDELIFSQYLENRKEEMVSFVETMKKINKEYNAKDLETSNKESPFGGNKTLYIRGVYDEDIYQLKCRVTDYFGSLRIISVVGMAGIGKTTIVETLYNDPLISSCFDLHAIVAVGHNYHLKDILLHLLLSLYPKMNINLETEYSESNLLRIIHQVLKYRRYLIVFDDVWDIGIWDDILRYLPDNSNVSKIILTTRLSDLACDFNLPSTVHEIHFRNEEQSWNLFCGKVFVEGSCPPKLEKVGKKIVKKCGGLPIGIISIAEIISKAEKSLESWEKIAKNDNLLALALEKGSHMAESLFLSYKHLPPHLKECCLYFGVFPLNHEISVSKLFQFWDVEGLVEPKRFKTFDDTAREYLEDLVSNNIVFVRQQSSSGRVKTLSAHFFWHLWVREAANKKIFHIIDRYLSAFSEDIHFQRRLCIHKNAVLGFKRVSKSLESVSNLRSFLCTGPKHQYPVSICSGLTSIKVFDALTIRLYKFPTGILELVELKYLAFTYDGNLTSSISRLKNLEYLIVHRHHLTIINSSPSYMPIEIWHMQELRHLQVMGSDLPHPVDGSQLPNLLTLLGVSDHSCTKEVLQSVPNLEKLGVHIVLPQGVFETLPIFDHIFMLSTLKSFKCIVSNPNPRSQQVLLLPDSVFPSSLTKLTLSGCGLAWKHMLMIGALPNLQVLKLRCYAFQGPEWVVNEEEFPKLQYLMLEDLDLVHWRGDFCFLELNRLIIRHCFKLEKIPEVGEFLEVIELVDCSSSATASAKHILEQYRENGDDLQVHVYSSLDDEKH